MSFNDRSKYHDEIAIPYTIKKLQEIGCTEIVPQGHEFDSPELRKLLSQRFDATSLMKRFKPDIIAARNDDLLYCEIKSDQGNHSNYAIEFDSYIAAREHNKSTPVIYSFVDISLPPVGLIDENGVCSASHIPFPSKVLVPKRPDYQKNIQRLKSDFSSIIFKEISYKRGSGTPYFLISKTSPFILEWERFFKEKVEQLSFLAEN